MDWFTRLGAMYQLLNDTPALAQDFALRGPQSDLGYTLAYAAQNTQADIDVYPADMQTLAG
ncbi:MAG: hypothetical protein ACTHON_15070 [Humibacter sp.]